MITRVTVFGGQGSRFLFSKEAVSRALNNVRRSTKAAFLLSRCHAAFLDELLHFQNNGAASVIDELKPVTRPEDLLSPSISPDNPIMQGVGLCVYQLLEYLVYAVPESLSLDSALPIQIDEAVGFCSGVLPAVVLCSSSTIRQYIDYGIQAVRLAFWIGYRVAEHCEGQCGHGWMEFGPWAMALTGKQVDYEEVKKRVDSFNAKHISSPKHQLSVSAINGASSISIAGSGPALQEFQSCSGLAGTFEVVPVYGLYHGGERSLPILQRVLNDCECRGITFPDLASLQIPLRSSSTGSFVDVKQGADAGQLLELALRSILIDAVQWQATWKNITQIALNVDLYVEILAIGPISRSLLPLRHTVDTSSRARVKILDSLGNEARNETIMDTLEYKDSIAIVGMSVNFPIGSDKDTFWESLQNGLNVVQEVPNLRFDVSSYPGDSTLKAARHGNFLAKPWEFDHEFFKLSPREVKSMDPQQRLLLQAAVRALDDAGYSPDSTPTFQRSGMGCYIGVATDDYRDNLRNDIDVYYSTGTLRAFLSGKLSYAFKFSGPSIVVDTACSSSLVAIYQACRALRNGDCCSAIAGGVNSITSTDMYQGLARAHFLSSTGQCKSFDASADGYCRAEGCGLFVLKRLSDAISENDRIYGVIRGIGVNQCGNAHSITHPHQETQQALFRQLLSETDIDPCSVSVVEAHGTGTQAGDATEIASLSAVFGRTRKASSPLFITSVKANSGHSEAASGAAGLAKLLLMLREKKIPPQISLQNLNPQFADIRTHNLEIATKLQDWQTIDARPRRSLLNNFGAAGSNASLLLEEFRDVKVCNPPRRSAYLFRFSAHSIMSLERLRKQYIDWLSKQDNIDVRHICYTASARRQIYEFNTSVVCENLQDLCAKLGQLENSRDAPLTVNRRTTTIAFVYSGQGASYFGMGKELLTTSPVFRDSVLECDRALKGMGFPSVLPVLEYSERENAMSTEEHTVAMQSSCFVLQYSLAQLWRSWNIIPQLVLGHSLGEYAAMVEAGVISLEDALRIVATRASLMTQHCAPLTTGMLACRVSSDDILATIKSEVRMEKLSLACCNSLSDCVVSGPLDQIQALKTHCMTHQWKCKQLDVPFGFHSAAMDPVVEPLNKLCLSIKLFEPRIPIGTNLYGRQLKHEDLSSHYFADQMRNTVQFSKMVQSLSSDADSSVIYIEIGPAASTLPMIKNSVREPGTTYLASLSPKQSPWATLSTSLAQAGRHQDGINWRSFFDLSGAKLIDLPDYPLEKSEVFVPFKTASENVTSKTSVEEHRPSYPLGLREVLSASTQQVKVYETDVATLAPYIVGHIVGGVPLCPASVYHEIVLEGGVRAAQSMHDNVLVVQDAIFDKPLVYYAENDRNKVRLLLSTDELTADSSFVPATFRIVSLKPDTDEESTHCRGSMVFRSTLAIRDTFARNAAMVKRQRLHLRQMNRTANTFVTRMIYGIIFPRVVEYSRRYQTITQLTTQEDGSEGFGLFKLSTDAETQEYILPPTFVDSLLHAAGFIANSNIKATEAYICTEVESFTILYSDIDCHQTFAVYCSLLDCMEDAIIADAYAMTENGTVLATVLGMHFKKLHLKSFQAHLTRQASQNRLASKLTATNHVKTYLSQKVDSFQLSLSDKETSAKQGNIGLDSPAGRRTSFGQHRLDAKGQNTMKKPAILDLGNTSVHFQPEAMVRAGQMPILGYSPPESPVSKIKAVVQAVCDVSMARLEPDTTLKSLGVDSLLSIELHDAFMRELQVDIPMEAFDDSMTLEALGKLVYGGLPEQPTPQSPTEVSFDDSTHLERTILNTLQSFSNSMTPLFLFHDGSGSTRMYSNLKKLDRPVFGFANRHLAEEQHWASSLVEMAAHYASVIIAMPYKSVILGGWSFGGVLAYEVAQQLTRQNCMVKGVVLIDSPCPRDHDPLPEVVIQHILKPLKNASSTGKDYASAIAFQFRTHADFLSRYRPRPFLFEHGVCCVMLQSQETMDTSRSCGVAYPWLESEEARSSSIKEWEEIAGHHMDVLPIPGNHFEPFMPCNVDMVSSQLKKACNLIDCSK